MEIIVGREPHSEMPRLRMTDGSKTVFLGAPGSVSRKVSREHCLITVSSEGKISIADITENNVMFVNGTPCKSKKDIMADTIVELGPDHYHLDLSAVIKAFQGALQFNISHLGKVFNEYQEASLKMQTRNAKINALSGLTLLFTLGSTALAGIFPEARVVGIILAVIFVLAMFAIRIIGASSNPRKKLLLDEKFRKEYVCPNPQCRRSLKSMHYDELKTMGSCPYCKSKFVE